MSIGRIADPPYYPSPLVHVGLSRIGRGSKSVRYAITIQERACSGLSVR
jgi:hypothetical protein